MIAFNVNFRNLSRRGAVLVLGLIMLHLVNGHLQHQKSLRESLKKHYLQMLDLFPLVYSDTGCIPCVFYAYMYLNLTGPRVNVQLFFRAMLPAERLIELFGIC